MLQALTGLRLGVMGSPPMALRSDRFSCCSFLGSGSVGENLFVDDRRFHLTAAVAALVVVGVDELRYCAAGLGFGGEVSA